MWISHSAVNYVTIIAYASDTFLAAHSSPAQSKWLRDFAGSRKNTNNRSYAIATTLALVTASIKNNQPLPPHLVAPRDVLLSEQLAEAEAADMLHLSNVNQPGFRAFSTVEVAYSGLLDSIESILKHVRTLVGEVDFSYDIISTPVDENGVLGEEEDPEKEVKDDWLVVSDLLI